MKISVVTISFNQAKYLKQCVESVMSQSYSNFEYIIVDPGSTDGSQEYIESLNDSRVTKIFKADCGPADGLNNGLSVCSGDIFYYLNSDDVVNLDCFERIVSKFNADDVDVLLGCAQRISARGIVEDILYPTDGWSLGKYVQGSAVAIQQATFFSLNFIRRHGITFNCNNQSNWDSEFLVDVMISGGRLKFESAILASFRVYPESISGSKRDILEYCNNNKRIRARVLNHFYKTRKIGDLLRFYLFGFWVSIARSFKLRMQ